MVLHEFQHLRQDRGIRQQVVTMRIARHGNQVFILGGRIFE
jgi:hypothetical protein